MWNCPLYITAMDYASDLEVSLTKLLFSFALPMHMGSISQLIYIISI